MYRLTSEQQQIASSAATLADRHVTPYAAEIDQSAGFPRHAITALGESACGGVALGKTLPLERLFRDAQAPS